MKIAFSNTVGGGAENSVRTTVRWLLQAGHTVHVIFPNKVPQWEEESPNLHLHSFPGASPIHYYVGRLGFRRTQYPLRIRKYEGSRNLARALQAIKSTQGLDLVELLEGSASPHMFGGIPFVVRLRGSDWTFNHYCEDKPYYRFQINNERKMLLAAQQAYSPSRSLADFIAGACDIPRRLIQIVPNMVDTQLFRPGPPLQPVPPFRLMSVGRLEKRKGTHLTVRALREVWKQEPDTHLYLYGSNHDFGKEQIEAELPPEVHQGRIHFEGFVPWQGLIEHYQQAHVLVAPTRYESFGRMVLEAMACGRPVIGADIGGVPEMVRHQETGWLVPRDDVPTLAHTILEALRENEKRELYGQAARHLAEKFAVDRLMPRQLALYEEAATQSQKSR